MIANRCPNPNCEYFNRTLPNNAKVCPMCGTPLGNVIGSTAAHNHQVTPVVERSPTTPPISSPPPAPTSPTYTPPQSPARPILILTHTNGKEFRLLGEEGNIGRRTPTHKTLPEIDLTGIPNEGIVSRTHARIYWDKSQNVYVLVDNSSRNGTYLNGNLLSANVAYRLNHNDSLQLGQDQLVCFTVSLV
ncbi:MAG: FHA domain-containing protein [Rhizonema sp. PD37]|nr:FHA domain-containing protein [Rhizonema sp. PD37]